MFGGVADRKTSGVEISMRKHFGLCWAEEDEA